MWAINLLTRRFFLSYLNFPKTQKSDSRFPPDQTYVYLVSNKHMTKEALEKGVFLFSLSLSPYLDIKSALGKNV
jgi:hypothetical protein